MRLGSVAHYPTAPRERLRALPTVLGRPSLPTTASICKERKDYRIGNNLALADIRMALIWSNLDLLHLRDLSKGGQCLRILMDPSSVLGVPDGGKHHWFMLF